MSRLRIAITGASGRMGRMLIEAVLAADDLELTAALVREGSPALGEDAGVAIETAELAALHHWAEVCGGGGKPSGAGGGDCGVAIVFGDEKLEGLEAAWRRVGLEPLRLSVSDAGVRVIRIISET